MIVYFFSRLELRNLMTRPELFIMKSDFSATVRMPHVSDIMHPHFRKNSHLYYHLNFIIPGVRIIKKIFIYYIYKNMYYRVSQNNRILKDNLIKSSFYKSLLYKHTIFS